METKNNKFRPTPDRLIIGPVKVVCGMVHDAEGNHILDIRGWGRIQYYENAEGIQDKIAQWVVDAINEKLDKQPI